MTALEVRGLTVRYREVLALDDVSLNVRAGEACGLIGVNGSGKTTLFRAVLELVRTQRGTVEVLGETAAQARARGAVGYVPQADQLDRDFPVTVGEVVLMGRYHLMGARRRPAATDRDAVHTALARAGVVDLARRRFGELSGGQRQRVMLARALAQEARVLLLDEPFTGVDVPSQQAVVGVLRELVEQGCAVLLSTHDLGLVPDLCRRSVLLHRRVLASGPTADVLTAENLARGFGLDVGEVTP